jgi:hypothetical protein
MHQVGMMSGNVSPEIPITEMLESAHAFLKEKYYEFASAIFLNHFTIVMILEDRPRDTHKAN